MLLDSSAFFFFIWRHVSDTYSGRITWETEEKAGSLYLRTNSLHVCVGMVLWVTSSNSYDRVEQCVEVRGYAVQGCGQRLDLDCDTYLSTQPLIRQQLLISPPQSSSG